MVLADGIVVRENAAVGGSRGLYATKAIAAGQMVWREDSQSEPQFTSAPRTLAWVEALPPDAQAAYRHFMCVLSPQSLEAATALLCANLRVRCAL